MRCTIACGCGRRKYIGLEEKPAIDCFLRYSIFLRKNFENGIMNAGRKQTRNGTIPILIVKTDSVSDGHIIGLGTFRHAIRALFLLFY